MARALPRAATCLLVAGVVYNNTEAAATYSDQMSLLLDSNLIATEDFESYPLGNPYHGGVLNYSFADFFPYSKPSCDKDPGRAICRKSQHNTWGQPIPVF